MTPAAQVIGRVAARHPATLLFLLIMLLVVLLLAVT